jgi:pilus assembly protein CpaE
MHAVVMSEDRSLGSRLQELLFRHGYACQPSDVVSFEYAMGRLIETRPELVAIALSPDVEKALAMVRNVRGFDHTRIIAIGPGTDASLILRTLRAGADQYGDAATIDTTEFADIFPISKGESHEPLEPGRIIAILACGGGTGSTTLAVNLAVVLAKQHERCALIDLQLDTDDHSALLSLKPTHSLADLCANAARIDRTMFEDCLMKHATGVQLLAAPQRLEDIDRVTAVGVHQALVWARALFPFVVADLSHTINGQNAEALRLADTVVIDFRLDFTSLRTVQRQISRLERTLVPRDRLFMIADRFGQPGELRLKEAEQCLGVKVDYSIPDDPKAVNVANNKGIPAVVDSPKARFSKSIVALGNILTARHQSARTDSESVPSLHANVDTPASASR